MASNSRNISQTHRNSLSSAMNQRNSRIVAPLFQRKPVIKMIRSIFLFILIASTIIAHIRPSLQEGIYCLKGCTCDDQKLEVVCKESIGIGSAIPLLLNPGIKRMVLHNTQISTSNGLDNYPHLETVDLSHNKLSVLEFGEIGKPNPVSSDKAHLGDLRSLNANHNLISELNDNQLNKLLREISDQRPTPDERAKFMRKIPKINIIELVLSHNHLTNLQNFTFLRWHKLQKLDLSHNYLAFLDTDSLLGLYKLEILDLRNNRLLQVPELALHGTVRSFTSEPRNASLRILNLSENDFSFISDGSFKPFTKMQELYLDSSSISRIDNGAFDGLNTLEILSLENNNLQHIPRLSLTNLRKLRILKLNKNNIHSIQSEAFVNLAYLIELQLNNNSIESLHDRAFEGLTSLTRLELSFNQKLVELSRENLDSLPKLNYLNLRSNSIHTLWNISKQENPLEILDLRGNQLRCDCDLKWLTHWLKVFNETYHDSQRIVQHRSHLITETATKRTIINHIDPQALEEFMNLTCYQPPALAGRLVIELPDNKLECLEPSSGMNVKIGYGSLVLMVIVMSLVCLVNLCRNKEHLFVILKESLVSSHMRTYEKELHDTPDCMRTDTQLHEYEPIEYGRHQAPIYTLQNEQYYEQT